MNWTKNDIQKLNLGNNYTESVKNSAGSVNKIPKVGKISLEKETIRKVLWVFHREGIIPEYVEELEFSQDRKFRFDWAIPELMIAIEYEGIISQKSGHTTINGYTKDCVKYNLATLEGWKVLRYTAKNYNDLSKDLKFMLKK